MSYPDEFTREQEIADTKVKRFRAMDPYDQIAFWKDHDSDYYDVLHLYLMDRDRQEISFEELAEFLFDNISFADETIIDNWCE